MGQSARSPANCAAKRVYIHCVEQLDESEPRDFTGAPGQQFKALIRTSTTNEKEAKQWLSSMMEHSQCTYRTSRTYKPTMTCVLYKVDMHCQHKRKVLTTKQRAKMSCCWIEKKENRLPFYSHTEGSTSIKQASEKI